MHDIPQDADISEAPNPFASRDHRRRRRDFVVSLILRGATYFIIVCAAYIFADITIKGIPVVFKTTPPFVNTDFFTKSPETLMTFETSDGLLHKMDFSEYSQFKRDNPGEKIIDEKSHAFSGGGILVPLVGTALLTIICIVVAFLWGSLPRST